MIFDPTHAEAGSHIRSLIRAGALDFDAVVSELKDHGIIDMLHDALSSASRPTFNRFSSDEFDALFTFFYPGEGHSMKVMTLGISGIQKEVMYVLYDANRVRADEIETILKEKYPPL